MATPDPEAENPPPRYPEDAEEPLGLDPYLRSDDRAEGFHGRTPFFEGRDEPLQAFDLVIKAVSAGRFSDQTMVFQGAPGAGKSALLEECVDRLVRRSSRAGEILVPVRVTADDFEDPVDLHRRIQGALAEYTAAESLAERRRIASMIFAPTSPPDIADPNEPLGLAYPEARILLLLDEAQNLRDEGKTAGIVQRLQQGALSMPTEKCTDVPTENVPLPRLICVS